MAIQDIEKGLEMLQAAKIRLSELRQGLEKLRDVGGHQSHLLVNIGGIRIDATELSRETGYMAKLKRGHEMIHLGAIKVFESSVSEQEDRVDWLASEASRLLEAEIQELQGENA